MEQLRVKKLASKRIRQGYPMLEPLDFIKPLSAKEGALVEIVDEKSQFLAKAYIGSENKAVGWVLTRKEDEAIDKAFFSRLFEKAREKRLSFEADATTTAYRFFNGEGDGLGGLTIERYEDYYVFSWYSEGIYAHRQMIYEAFEETMTNPAGIYEKLRFKTSQERSRFVSGEEAPEPLVVMENGIRFAVYLNDGLMTGIFLDQRNVRGRLMEEYAAGKTVLNTFSYTGAFSVAAAMGGAAHTTSVDLANRSLERTREQFEVNELSPDDHTIRVIDVFNYFNYAKRHELTFDVVVVDPPTFARSKKRTFSVEKDYVSLLEDIIDVTAPGGLMVVSTNSRKVTREEFAGFVEEAFDNKGQSYSIVEEHRAPEDFTIHPAVPSSDYLKVFFVQKED